MMTSILLAIVFSGYCVNFPLSNISSGTEIVGFTEENILGIRGSKLISITTDKGEIIITENVRSIKSLHSGTCIIYLKDNSRKLLYKDQLYDLKSNWETIAQDSSGNFYCIASRENGQLTLETYADLISRPINSLRLPQDFSDARFIKGTYPDQIALVVNSRDREYPELLIIKQSGMTRRQLSQSLTSFSPQFHCSDGSLLGFTFPTPLNDLDPLFEGFDYRFGTEPTIPNNHPAVWDNSENFASKLEWDSIPEIIPLRIVFATGRKYLIEANSRTLSVDNPTPIYLYSNPGSPKIIKLNLPPRSRLIDTNFQTGTLLFANDSTATIIKL